MSFIDDNKENDSLSLQICKLVKQTWIQTNDEEMKKISRYINLDIIARDMYNLMMNQTIINDRNSLIGNLYSILTLKKSNDSNDNHQCLFKKSVQDVQLQQEIIKLLDNSSKLLEPSMTDENNCNNIIKKDLQEQELYLQELHYHIQDNDIMIVRRILTKYPKLGWDVDCGQAESEEMYHLLFKYGATCNFFSYEQGTDIARQCIKKYTEIRV